MRIETAFSTLYDGVFDDSITQGKEAVLWQSVTASRYRFPVLAGKIVLRYVGSGSWGSALTSATATLADNTQYTIRVFGRQREVTVVKVGESGANFTHGIAARPSNLIAKVAHILKWFNTHGDKQTPAPNDQGATKASP